MSDSEVQVSVTSTSIAQEVLPKAFKDAVENKVSKDISCDPVKQNNPSRESAHPVAISFDKWQVIPSTDLLPADFGWRKLEKVCNILKLLQELTLLLQGDNAGVSMAIKAVKFLKHLTNSDPA